MANDTVLIIAPEHGRNLNTNTSIDGNGRLALDHTAPVDLITGDQTAREIFCMVLGPPSVVKQGQVINTLYGESIEIAPMIANLLGFDTNIPGGKLKPYNLCEMGAAFI
jgi:hypothetical protein